MSLLIIIFRAALFYLIPLSIGFFLSLLTKKVIQRTSRPLVSILKSLESKLLGEQHLTGAMALLQLPWYFCLGVLFLLALATLTKLFVSVFSNYSFIQFYLPIVYSLFFSGGIVAVFKSFKLSFNITLKEIVPLSVLTLLTMIVIFIWNWKTPYSLNWDLYEHQVIARLIQQGEFSFQTVQMSDTFGFSSYPPTFHLLLATSQPLVEERPQDILLYWQWLGYFHLLTVSIASYYIGLALTRNRDIALLSGIVGTTIFESAIAFTSLFALPQTITATIFALAFSGVLLSSERFDGRLPLWKLLILSLSFFLMHYVIGLMAALILIGTHLFLHWQSLKKLLTTQQFRLVYLGILLLLSGLTYFIDLSWINAGEAAAYLFSLQDKFNFSLSIYGLSLAVFGGVGLYSIQKRKFLNKYVWIVILLGFGALLLSNIPYVLKFYTLARYFIHPLMALGIVFFLQHIKIGKLLAVSVISSAFLILFVLNTVVWKDHVLYMNRYSHLSDDDLAAAKYLQEYIAVNPQPSMLISDPTTMYLMEGLSGINTPGGAFATVETRTYLYQALSSDSLLEIKNITNQIIDPVESTNQHKLLVLSGRTFQWYILPESLRNAYDFNIWHPEPLSYYDTQEIDAFIPDGTSVLFQNTSYVILKI